MRISTSSTLLFFCAIFCGNAFVAAQDEPAAEPQVQTTNKTITMVAGDGVDPIVISSTSDGVGGSAGLQSFKFSNGDGASASMMLPKMSFIGKGGIEPLSQISDPSVQKDLELLPDQVEQLTAIQKSFSQELNEQISKMTADLSDTTQIAKVGKVVKELQAAQNKKLESLLLPHQVERLKQIAIQRQMQMTGAASALASDQLVEALAITDEQKERLQKRSEEIKIKLEEKLEQLREDAKNELLNELTAEQREKLNQLTGEKFKTDPKDWNEKYRQMKESKKEKP